MMNLLRPSHLTFWKSGISQGLMLTAVIVAGLSAGCIHAQTATLEPPASTEQIEPAKPVPLTVTLKQNPSQEHLVELASRGQFVDILDTLKADGSANSNPAMQRLVSDLELYKQHQELHATEKLKNYKAAREAMTREINEGRLEVALIKAIDAHSHAPQGRQMLQDQQVVDLVEKSSAAATAAEAEGDWLAALTLWRNLDLLYLEDSTYHDHVKNAELHARLLRLYAPDELQRLHIQREARKGNPTPEPLLFGSDTWQDRLKDVRVGMIYDAMREAKNRHIDSPSYAKLFHGSIVRLGTLVESKGLALTFANLADANKIQTFEAHLASIDQQLTELGDTFSYRQLIKAVDSVLQANKDSVQIPEQILIFEMTEGAMAELDPFSAVIWPHDLAQFSRNTEGKFSGVGIQISRPGLLTATEVTPGSASEKAGVKAGDVITQINGKDTTTIGVSEAMRLLNVAKDQTIELKANRPGQVGTLDFKIQSEPSVGDQSRPNDQGLTLKRPGRLTVVSPLPGTPAHRAGIKPNDLIISVNNQDTTGWSLDQAVREITGPEGSPVSIGIERKGVDKTIEFKLTRSSIEIDSIRGWKLLPGGKWDYFIDTERQIGYIRLSQFIPQSSDDMDAAFNEMNKQGRVQAVILDLRYNPGGLLRKAADIVDRFVLSGRIVSTVDAEGNTTSQYSARPHNTLRQMPMVVLINQGSASASEIVSGALQDYQTALIVGERSYGKGSVQDLTYIDSSRALLKLTTQYYKLPGGRIIHRKPKALNWGIEPGLKIDMTEQQAFDAIELRRDLDVLHEAGDHEDPEHPFAKAEDMFTRALDPQLEAGLMYLRVRLASDMNMAAKPAASDNASPLPLTP